LKGDRKSGEDLNQEGWLHAISSVKGFDPARGELRDWLFGIARLQVALHFRRLSRPSARFVAQSSESIELADSTMLLPEEVMERVERLQLVRAAWTAIPQS